MKRIAPILCMLVSLVLISCTQDPCKDVVCENGGACFDGNCQCAPGFSGEDCSINDCDALDCQNGGICETGTCDCPMEFTGRLCETRVTDGFAGVFIANQRADNTCLTKEYAVVISSGPEPRDLLLYNIQDDSLYTEAYLEDPNYITFQKEGVIAGSLAPYSPNEIYASYISNTGPDCQFILRRLF